MMNKGTISSEACTLKLMKSLLDGELPEPTVSDSMSVHFRAQTGLLVLETLAILVPYAPVAASEVIP